MTPKSKRKKSLEGWMLALRPYLDSFIEYQEYQHFLEVSGRLDAEEFELAGYDL